MAFSCLIPGAGGSYTLTQGHSFMRMGNVVNTWVHDVSLSSVISLGPSCARQCMNPRELFPALVFAGEEWGLWRAQAMRGGEKAKHKVCASAGMFVTRAWTHKSWLPLAVLWDSAASQILIKIGGKGELFQLEQLPCCIIRLLSCSGGALPQQFP